MIRPPHEMGAFEFVAVAALRAAQLASGCRARVDGDHTTAVFAQREVAEGKVIPTANATADPRGPHLIGSASVGNTAGRWTRVTRPGTSLESD